jgi:hypothetical protein
VNTPLSLRRPRGHIFLLIAVACLSWLPKALAQTPVAPAVTTANTTLNPILGSSVSFTISAAGSPPLAYQWDKATNSGTGIIAGATSPTLTIPNVQDGDRGIYYITVTNGAGSTHVFVLSVVPIYPPSWYGSQPGNQTVRTGNIASVMFGVTGTPPFSYQTFKNGTLLASGSSDNQFTAFGFSTISAQPSDSGTYQVKVTNAAGTITSNAVSLTVDSPPIIATQPSGQLVIAGSTASFSVSIVAASSVTYQWYKGSTPIPGATASTLTLTNVQPSDAGPYQVTATNNLGFVSSNVVSLTVRTVPVISGQPANAIFGIGGSGTVFSVAANSVDPISYQWQKNGSAIAGANGPTFSLSNSQLSDAGTYSVVLTNAVGSTTSNSVSLAVGAPPVFVNPLSDQFGAIGGTFTFAPVVSGVGPLAYQWWKGSTLLDITSSSLTITNATAADFTSYHVFITNQFGTIDSVVALRNNSFVFQVSNTVQTYDGTPKYVTVTTTPAGIPYTVKYVYIGVSENMAVPVTEPTEIGTYLVAVTSSDPAHPGGVALGDPAVPRLQIKPGSISVTLSGLQQTYDGTPRLVTATPSRPGQLVFFFYNGSNTPPVDAGTYSVVAYLPDTFAWLIGSGGTGTLVVAKANQTITFGALPTTLTVGTPIAFSATTSSGLAVSFEILSGNATLNGGQLTLKDTNPVVVRATQPGDANHNPASADLSLSTGKQSQTIDFAAISDHGVTDAPITLAATASSGLAVAVTVVSGPATLNGNTLTLTGTGTVVVQATQPGDAIYSAAAPVTHSFTVTAKPPPTITTQPANQSVAVGGTATFSVAVADTNGVTYSWVKNGAPFGIASSPTFTLSNLQIADGGTFSVVVSNGAASVTSASATLIINSPSNSGGTVPAITNQPASQTAAVGGSATFSVGASGTAPLSYQWKRDGIVLSGASTATLSLTSIQSSDAGSYTVVVTNTAGNATSSAATLTVGLPGGSKPAITVQPASLSLPSGVSASFVVTAVGAGPLTFQWQKGGIDIPGATNSLFLIPSIQASDVGAYSVTVSNSAGSVVSAAATLSITATGSSGNNGGGTSGLIAPAFVLQPKGQTLAAGTSATLSVQTTGSPTLTYQWYHNGAAIVGANAATLTISNAQTINAGDYTVQVQNAAARATSEIATILVKTTNYSGAYFGDFSNGEGTWAIYVRPDGSGQFVAYLTKTKSAFSLAIQVTADGSFVNASAGTASGIKARPISLGIVSGKVAENGTVTGSIAGISMSFTGKADSNQGTPNALSGLYVAPAIGVSNETVYTIVGNSGHATVIAITGDTGDLASGTITSTGTLTATTSNGGNLNITIDSNSSSIKGAFAGATSSASFAGISDASANTTRLVNLSVRSFAGPGDEALIVGFVIGGNGSKQVLVRGIGPSLAQFGISNAIAAADLTLYSGGQAIQTNANWGGNTDLVNAFAHVGAFSLAIDSHDDAFLSSLSMGAYSAQMTPDGNGGVGLIEAYDSDIGAANTRLINLSARTLAGNGDRVLAAGFVLRGNSPKKILIRGIGPTLSQFNVTGVLADPELTLFDATNSPIQKNDDWGGSDALGATFAQVGAFSLPPQSTDATLLVTLLPGSYTAQVTGKNGASGIAMIELYEVP